ncbi:HCNGP-like protein-domain-containing protein [Hypoxylon fragiforme]|uniref:HCNGP-like protein-domain-containing protein n=1 Tax=Hypoxylon fragiforme TaxID=63214 RepID=UPI0020C71DFC|nr:HCNGP-like protein-domain-containing protein [Hypoxylon fragiforme]KAI2613913.1 HCNGP-like protein-domain-containing protein [Hypoxylon fragiforme]
MALVGYDSSDDEEEVPPQPESKSLKPAQDTALCTNGKQIETKEPSTTSQKQDEEPAAIIGPQVGPDPSAGPTFPPLEEAPMEDDDDSSAAGPGLPPGSPYTATRALLRDLTLPPLPNTEIPPSPPGSPPPGTSAKFERFLELKKQGVHFNSKVAQNPSLRNPALTDKLLAFVELASPADQYRTALAWDPTAFPRWAYKEQLKLTQAETEKARARRTGAPVEFVPATTTTTAFTASTAAGAGGISGGEGSAALVASGALQGSSAMGPKQGAAGKRKTRFDARG